MTEFRNALTWEDTVTHAVEVYGFIILKKGWMSGQEFADEIRKHYRCSDEREKAILADVGKHLAKIKVTHGGTCYQTV